MDEYFKYLVERAFYYALFESFRNEYQQSSGGIEQEWISLEVAEKTIQN
ncbi:TPA: hypothetical protein HA338_14920 [Methanosarcina acetivorans]|uniref:Uncharacterized protein n=1 Tax=Methanosarcina acetivorans TaxID=2214 RepID=A0A832VZQ9_9EURY|nr:hypothetical protein [Methanosarcina acetivorans]HIH95252.1 hypothetical protein [Methanosarcina acetivorans]